MNIPLGVSPSKGNQGTTRGGNLRRESPPKSSPTFSVRPRSSVGRVTVYLIQRSWVRFPPRSKDFFFTSCGSLIPFTRANAHWDNHGFISTLIYTSELILCFIICVPCATRHNIHIATLLGATKRLCWVKFEMVKFKLACQHDTTSRKGVAKRALHVAPNKVATVWPGLTR